MFKHTRLLYGYLALIGGAFVGYLVFWLITPSAFENFFWLVGKGLMPVPGAPANLTVVAYIVLGHYWRHCCGTHRRSSRGVARSDRSS